jgi:transposase
MGRPADFRLTTKEYNALVEARKEAKKAKDAALSLHIRGLLLVASGKTREEAAEMCEVSVRAIFRWQERYREGGIEGLRAAPRPGRERRLTEEQRQELAAIVEAGPAAAGLDVGIWTSPILAEVIRRRFGVRYSHSQVRRILHQLGFSVQFPRKKLARADHQAQEEWLNETLPGILKRVKEEGGVFFLRTRSSSSSPGRRAGPGHRWVRARR